MASLRQTFGEPVVVAHASNPSTEEAPDRRIMSEKASLGYSDIEGCYAGGMGVKGAIGSQLLPELI